jgi:hypothetical protein
MEMMYVNGRKVLKSESEKMMKIDADGWDSYDGRNHQWYSLRAKQLPDGILYCLDANNSGDCYGDYKTRWFFGGEKLMQWISEKYNPYETAKEAFGRLLGNDISENDELINAVLADCGM